MSNSTYDYARAFPTVRWSNHFESTIPPRSPNLSPSDSFVWGCIKDKAYIWMNWKPTYPGGRAIAQAVSRCFPPRRPGFDPGSGQVGFVVDKVALGLVFSEYFGFPCQSSFHQLLHNHPHLSSVAGIIGQKWPQNTGLSPTPLEKKSHLLEQITFTNIEARSSNL
jgi:hypothetical protein